jgi:hypothetical protein
VSAFCRGAKTLEKLFCREQSQNRETEWTAKSNAMSDTMKILCAVGLGVYSSVGLYFYTVLATRTKNAGLQFLLYLTSIALFLGGGLVGSFAIWGMFDHVRQTPTPNDKIIGTVTLLTWVGILLLYIILDWRGIRQRLGYPYANDSFLTIYRRRRAHQISIPKKNWKVGAAMSLFAAVCFGGAAIIYAKSSKPDLAILYCSLTTLYFVLSAVFFKKSKQP